MNERRKVSGLRRTRVRAVPGERLVFQVQSVSRPAEWHRVDLLAHAGKGECSCEDWQLRRWPAIKLGGTVGIFCAHVIAARTVFLNDLLARMAREESAPCGESNQS